MTKGAELLEFPSGAKLLIVHADDFGMCNSVNRAIIASLQTGAISSASVMVPCPGFPAAAEWCALHPEYDVGIHSTLISEWNTYKWGPVSRKAHSAGLVDEEEHFWPRNSLLRASPEEIEDEIAAQIIMAKAAGLQPTHLDSHMLSVARPDYILAYVMTARKFRLPFLIDEYWYSRCSSQLARSPADVVIDTLAQAQSGLSIDSLEEYYISVLHDLKPGLHQLILHPGLDDPELRHITGEAQAYGAAWRQRDFDIVRGNRFRSALQDNEIRVVNWRMIKSAISKRMTSLPRETRRVV